MLLGAFGPFFICSHQLSAVSHQTRISHLASRISHLAPLISNLASRTSHLASRISHLGSLFNQVLDQPFTSFIKYRSRIYQLKNFRSGFNYLRLMSLNLGLIGRAQPLEWPKLGHINGNLMLFCKILRFTNRFFINSPKL